MDRYHNPPTCHSMISPSQLWALQAPTPPFPGISMSPNSNPSLSNPGLAPLCPMELESRNQPPSVLSTTTNHKMTTRCLSVLILLYPVQPPGGAARGGHRVCDGEVRRWVVCWDQPKNRWNCCLRRQNMSFFLCFRNLRNFPRQLCDTDIATSGNLILAIYCTECSNLTLSLSPKTSPPNHHLVRLTSQLSLSHPPLIRQRLRLFARLTSDPSCMARSCFEDKTAMNLCFLNCHRLVRRSFETTRRRSAPTK